MTDATPNSWTLTIDPGTTGAATAQGMITSGLDYPRHFLFHYRRGYLLALAVCDGWRPWRYVRRLREVERLVNIMHSTGREP
jgi:hypothetical protein